jgi:hypothetical protein
MNIRLSTKVAKNRTAQHHADVIQQSIVRLRFFIAIALLNVVCTVRKLRILFFENVESKHSLGKRVDTALR